MADQVNPQQLGQAMQSQQPSFWDVLKAFGTGGLTGVAKSYGMQMPDWSNKLGQALQNPDLNAAIGMAAPVGVVRQTPLLRSVIARAGGDAEGMRPTETHSMGTGRQQPYIAQTPQEQEALLRQRWNQSGPELDYEELWNSKGGEKLWENAIDQWNVTHGTNLEYAGDLSPHRRSGFLDDFDAKYLAGKTAKFPGIKAANEYFNGNDNPNNAVYLAGKVPRAVQDEYSGLPSFSGPAATQ